MLHGLQTRILCRVAVSWQPNPIHANNHTWHVLDQHYSLAHASAVDATSSESKLGVVRQLIAHVSRHASAEERTLYPSELTAPGLQENAYLLRTACRST